jgi:hypothetical protein
VTTPHSGPSTRARRTRIRGGPVGAGAAACAVCCAAPLLTVLGIGLSGAAATAFTVAFAGLVFGIVVAVATVAAVALRRRQGEPGQCPDSGAPVTGPTPVQLLRSRPEQP